MFQVVTKRNTCNAIKKKMQNCVSATLHLSLALNPVKAWACISGLECCPKSAILKDPLLDRTSWNTESCKKLPLTRQRTPAHGMTCAACWESSYKYELVCQAFRLGRGCRWLCQRGSHYPNRQCHLLLLGTPMSLLQHWKGNNQDQRLKHLLLLSIIEFFLADYRLLLIPSECVCKMWSFHCETHKPKSQILKSGVSNWEHWESCPSYTKQHWWGPACFLSGMVQFRHFQSSEK